MSLFNETPLEFEKVAAGKRLAEDTAGWANEILAQLYSQHPYLGTYQVDYQVQNQNDETGYLYGYFLVSNVESVPPQDKYTQQVSRPDMANMEAASAKPEGPPSARVPVIVNAKVLSSMDVMITPAGQFLPMNESRLAENMTVPETFEAVNTTATGSPSANEYLPPERTGLSGGVSGPQVVKTSSLLEKIASSIPDDTRETFLNGLAEDSQYRYALENNEAFREAVGKLYRAKTAESAPEVVRKVKMWLPADAVHFEKHAGGFTMHSAAAGAYEPSSVHIPRECADLIPDHLLPRLMKEGSVLIHKGKAKVTDGEDFQPVTKTAQYKVATREGGTTRGTVFTDVVDLTGQSLDRQIFIEKGNVGISFQDKIAGAEIGPARVDQLNTGHVRGTGVFVSSEGRCTIPVKVANHINRPDGIFYRVTGPFRSGLLKMASILKNPVQTGHNEYAIPEDWKFVPFEKFRVLSDKPHLAKTASNLHAMADQVVITHSGGTFSVRGGLGVEDLPSERREFLKTAEASLLLGCIGVRNPGEKLASAVVSGRALAQGSRHITGYEEAMDSARKEASAILKAAHVEPVFLIKEAAALVDAASVDAVLSLGFVTPENVQAFVDELDTLEQTVGKLAELLIAVRLGLKEVPESAAERAMKGTEQVIQGLRAVNVSSGQQQAA